MTRFEAVQYISHGIAKRPGMSEPKHVRGVDEDQGADGREDGKKQPQDALNTYCVNLNKKAKNGRIDPLIGRGAGGDAHHPDSVPPAEEQPAVRGRSGRRQDRHRRGAGAQDRQRRRAGGAQDLHHLRARHGRAARRHALPRRLRGAAQGRHEGDRELSRRDPLHRRDPHRDRRRRHLGRRHGRLQPAEAGAAVGHAALHRLHHLQGVPPALREGPGAGAPLPEDRHQRADGGGLDRDPQGPEALLRGVPQAQVHQRGGQGGGGAVRQVHQRPQAARQGDRRDRRDRRLADAGAGGQAQEEDRRAGGGGHGGHHGPHSAQDHHQVRCRGAHQHREGPEAAGVRPGQGDRGAGELPSSSRAPACASRRSRSAAICSPAPPASARPRWRGSSRP